MTLGQIFEYMCIFTMAKSSKHDLTNHNPGLELSTLEVFIMGTFLVLCNYIVNERYYKCFINAL